jgi:cytoplasmic iron level regulating protein YaaA (DUF328/UPF0246 family)
MFDISLDNHKKTEMLTLLSPAKTLDFESTTETFVCTKPEFLNLTQDLIHGLLKLSTEEIGKLMNISPKLADLNTTRFQEWSLNHNKQNSKQAILAFKGDVYEGLRAWEFKKSDFSYAQKHLRVLSGLYGILKPLDLIQPYRLEMGTVYPNPSGKNLYDFWGDSLADAINKDLKKNKIKFVINLASQEYFKAAQGSKIEGEIISPSFLDEKNGKYKIISFYAKKARGYMANYIITNQVSTPDGLFNFDLNGYQYSKSDSSSESPFFVRSEKNRNAA